MPFFPFIRQIRLFTALLACVLMAGCAYKSEIRQGDALLLDRIKKLQTGMSKDEVRKLLGKNRLPQVFASENWVYYYRHRSGGFLPITSEVGVELVFDDDTLAEIRMLVDTRSESEAEIEIVSELDKLETEIEAETEVVGEAEATTETDAEAEVEAVSESEATTETDADAEAEIVSEPEATTESES